MRSVIKKYYLIVLFLLLTIFYFEYSVSITWDSAHYLGYIKILERLAPFSSWDVVRGPVFPIIIYLSNVLFSKTNHGLLVMTYLYYLIMLFFLAKLFDYSLGKIKIKNGIKQFIKYTFLFFIIINPAIYGYYHCLLTEFVAITLGVISCYFAVLWIDTDYFKERNKYIILSILFAFLTVFSWLLKQPYVSCGFFALFVAYIIGVFHFKNKKQFLVRTATILFCLICLFLSIKTWNYLLDSHGNDTGSTRNPTNSLGNQIVNAVDFLEVNNNKSIYDASFINLSKLSDAEKKEVLRILDENGKYVLIYKYNKKNKVFDVDYIKSTNGETISTFDSVVYILKIFVNHPIRLIDSYITNYFSIIDIYSTTTGDGVGYTSTKKVDINFSNEITVIGNKPYSIGDTNFFPLSDELFDNARFYLAPNNANNHLNSIMLSLSKINVLIFKFLFLLLPLMLVVAFVMKFIKKFKEFYQQLNIVIILFGFSFLHLLLHTVTGAIIDRYALPAFITTALGTILLLLVLFCNKLKKMKCLSCLEKSFYSNNNVNKYIEDFKRFFIYTFISGLSLILDLILFSLLFHYIVPNSNIIISTIGARIISSLFNYLCNKNIIFKNKDKKSIYKYYILVVVQMFVSGILVNNIYPRISINVTVLKFFVDLFIFVVNYFVQKLWVFKDKK